MTKTKLLQTLGTRQNGGIFTVKSRRTCRVKKNAPQIVKESVYQGMKCDYSSRKNVREAVTEGLREAPELPRGVKNCFYESGVKFYEGFDGSISLAVPVVGNKPQSKFFIGGKEISPEEAESYLLASEKPKEKTKAELKELGQEIFRRIKLDNIVEVN